MSDGTDLVDILNEAADENCALARVRRQVEDRPVCPRPEDFYAAMRHDARVVVRLSEPLPTESSVAIDCRYRDGTVEYTHDYRTCGEVTREAFVYDVRDTDCVKVIHHRDSQFDDSWTCPDCDEDCFNPDSRYLDGANEVRVECPECGAVEFVPQGSEPPRDPPSGEGVA